jgi:hypothetical protein
LYCFKILAPNEKTGSKDPCALETNSASSSELKNSALAFKKVARLFDLTTQ